MLLNKGLISYIDNTLKEGKFGTDFWGPVDNVIIAEKAADILTVEPMEKLVFSWGAIKRNAEFGVRIENWNSLSRESGGF